MAMVRVQITYGPEHPTRAALGFDVAKAALDEGHSVPLFTYGPDPHVSNRWSWSQPAPAIDWQPLSGKEGGR